MNKWILFTDRLEYQFKSSSLDGRKRAKKALFRAKNT